MGVGAPLDLGELAGRIAQRRGRDLSVVPYPFAVGVYGLWLALPDRDIVFHEERTTPDHQKDIVLHEFGHLLADHRGEGTDADGLAELMPTLPLGLVRNALRRTCHDAAHEREAELIATIISEWADRIENVVPSRSRGDSSWLDGTVNEPVGWL